MQDEHYSQSKRNALRAWLKLLSISNQIRKTLQSRLMARHGMSLARFDILANLYRAPASGLRLSTLSDQLMVSNGNVTQVLAPLVKDGLVSKEKAEDDARASIVKLTPAGLKAFEAMAIDHASWVEELLGDLASKEQIQLTELLGKINIGED
jgi:DNA-binding MarR family transcriptional regulator